MKAVIVSLLVIGLGLTALVCANVCCDKRCIHSGNKLKVDRESTYDINPLFMNRTSPYVFSGEAVTKQELYRLFDAARWRHHLTTNSHGDLFMVLKGQKHGTSFLS